MKVSILFLSLSASANAFSTPRSVQASFETLSLFSQHNIKMTTTSSFALNNDDQDLFEESAKDLERFNPIPAITASLITFSSTAANAADSPDWGKSSRAVVIIDAIRRARILFCMCVFSLYVNPLFLQFPVCYP
jgi:hypothetical protein